MSDEEHDENEEHDERAARPVGSPTFLARQRWQYKVLDGPVDAGLEAKLNRLGERGWEVCAFESHRSVGVLMRRIILKRPTLIAALPDG